jgi:3-hydroxyisobutyrate dehydrogenase-like beta-hydroxyacid dehydrogenase
MAEQKAPVRVGLIGFGEVGSSLGAGLRSAGVDVVAYDRGQVDSAFAALIQRRAQEAKVSLAASVAEIVEASDLILSAVPGSTAMEAAAEAARRLKPGQMYVDMGTASPPVKEKMAEAVESTGAAFVDVAIMSSPLEDRHRIVTIASGREAERYREMVEPFEMRVTVVGERPGRAAAIKMFRSIFMKGIEALVIETLMACETWDVADTVMGTVTKSLDKQPFYPDYTDFLVTTDAIHAERRAHEMDMVIQTMQDVGIEPRMTRATAEMIHWTAGLGLKEHFKGEVPPNWKVVVDEIFRRMERK